MTSDQRGLIVAALSSRVGMDRHVRDEVRPDADRDPTAGDRPTERLGQPLLAAVLDRMKGVAHGPMEWCAPLELEEWLRDLAGQPDRDACRQPESSIEGGLACRADRWTLSAAADT